MPTDPCPTCNGDGESDESPLAPCPTCLGSGRAASPQPDTAPDFGDHLTVRVEAIERPLPGGRDMMQSIWQKEVGKDTVDLADEHADPCIEETCSMCDEPEPATHKVAEDDSRNHGLFRTHPFTNYVCCEHFGQIMQVTCDGS